jgi:polyhydroxyalkanoate synthesis repressor PhaR
MTNSSDGSKQGGQTVRIKKYANRRLYNTSSSSYVTLDYLAQMVRDGVEFTVEDAKTNEDITRSVLTQIIVEEEAKGQTMLPINFLRQLISLYGDNLQLLVPRYLEQSMESFTQNQEQIREHMKDQFGTIFPVTRIEEMSKQNMAFFQHALNMWNPFKMGSPASPASPSNRNEAPGKSEPAAKAEGAKKSDQNEELSDLKAQMQALQRQLDQLTRAGQKAD